MPTNTQREESSTLPRCGDWSRHKRREFARTREIPGGHGYCLVEPTMPDKIGQTAQRPTENQSKLPLDQPGAEMPKTSVRSRALDPTTHDALLGSRIRQAFESAPEVDASDVRVVVRNRGVTLFGSVASPEQRDRIAELGRRVSGVVDLINYLKIVGPYQ